MNSMTVKSNIAGFPTPFGIEEEYTDYDKSKYHLLYIPYSETVSYLQGTENGPKAIIEASTQVELYDRKTESEPSLKGISYETINPAQKIETILSDTKIQVLKALKANKFPVLLGGEHTISHGAIEACAEYHPELTVLQIDAHADLREEYMNNPYSHACAMRHSYKKGLKLVQAGIRSLCKEEHLLIKNNPDLITTFFAEDSKLPIESIIASIKTPYVYITIDLDGLDPSVIPHVGTPEPGGIGWHDLLELLEGVFKKFTVLAGDIVELCPGRSSTVSDFASAKLLYRLLSLKNDI
jgi:agmatinase